MKIKYINAWEVSQVSIVQIAQDWGIDIYPKGNGKFSIYCPNPEHQDRHLGNCFITENEDTNCFYCFSCGAGGGPIQLVMYLDKCDYETAKYKIARKYNLIKTKYIDPKDLPPKWEGLNYEEYAEFGLKNSTIEAPIGIDENGQIIYQYKRYSLRDLAKDNPEAHDDMLIEKFTEKLINIAIFMSYLAEGRIPGQTLNKDWEDICYQYIEHLKELLKKGLIDKNKFYQLFKTNEELLAKCV